MIDLANALRDEGALDERECLIDATFASAKGGGEARLFSVVTEFSLAKYRDGTRHRPTQEEYSSTA